MLAEIPQLSSLVKTGLGLRQHVDELSGKASDRTKEKVELQLEVRLFAKWRNLHKLLIAKIICFIFFCCCFISFAYINISGAER